MPKNRRNKNKANNVVINNGQSEKVAVIVDAVEQLEPEPEPAPIDVQLPTEIKSLSPTMASTDVLKPIARKSDKNGRFMYVDLGKVVKNIVTNHFKIELSDQEVYRYDVDVLLCFSNSRPKAIQNKQKKRVLMDIAMGNGQLGYGYDGSRLLFTNRPIECPNEIKGKHLGEEFVVVVNKMTVDQPFQLLDVLRGDIADAEELITGLEIIMTTSRKLAFPSNRLRSLYFPMDPPEKLRTTGLELWAGFYSSVKKGQWGMTLNFDWTATTVIEGKNLVDIYRNQCHCNAVKLDRHLKSLKFGLKIQVQIGQQPHQKRTFEKIVNATAKSKTFPDRDNPSIKWDMVSYYREKFKVGIKNPDFPLVKIKSGQEVLYPLEMCSIVPGQLFQCKRHSREQAELIRFIGKIKANERFKKINDDFQRKFMASEQKSLLERFGISVDSQPLQIETARVLPPVKLSGAAINEKTGKFNVRKYLETAKMNDLIVVNTSERLKPEDEDQILNDLHWNMEQKGLCAKREEYKVAFSYEEIEKIISEACQNEEKQKQNGKNILIFLLDRRESDFYGFIKLKGNVNYQVVNQCIDLGKMDKMDQKYFENLMLKINCKLEGTNWRLDRRTFTDQGLPPMFDEPVLVMGADVTHPGMDRQHMPSIAAVVGCIDQAACNYQSVAWAQSKRSNESQTIVQEWIANMKEHAQTLLKAYRQNTGMIPKKIIFYRDGVSEGQYEAVLHKELAQIQQACTELDPNYKPAITYIVVRKRIKTKFFKKTQNGSVENVDPGTIIETDITQPMKFFDWFLVPHRSPLGTAKPTHYVVLYDDSNFDPNQIAYLSFALCHVFPRAAMAVSLPAPIFHAHLSAERAAILFEANSFSSNESRKMTIQERCDLTNQTLFAQTRCANDWL